MLNSLFSTDDALGEADSTTIHNFAKRPVPCQPTQTLGTPHLLRIASINGGCHRFASISLRCRRGYCHVYRSYHTMLANLGYPNFA
jgi:hypothetical protein